MPWAEITAVPCSRVARWKFKTNDIGYILLQRQNSWFAATWQGGHVGGQYNRIFFPRGKKCFCSWPPTWPPWPHVQTSNPIRFLHRTNAVCTAISREVVGKNMHATIPKGNMGYDQYTVPDDCSCRTYFCCFPLALGNTFPWPFVPILSNFFEKQRTQTPTMPLRIVAYTFPDNACYKRYKAFSLLAFFFFSKSCTLKMTRLEFYFNNLL